MAEALLAAREREAKLAEDALYQEIRKRSVPR